MTRNDGWFSPLIYEALVSKCDGERLNPVYPADEISKWLCSSGIRRVFSGHQPTGECPQAVRALSPQPLCFFMCDTSFSDMNADKSENPFNTRGQARSSVWVTPTTTEVKGLLADGSSHGYIVQADGQDSMPSALIGRQLRALSDPPLAAGAWVKTLTPPAGSDDCADGSSLWLPLVSRVNNYTLSGFREDGQRGLLVFRTVAEIRVASGMQDQAEFAS